MTPSHNQSEKPSESTKVERYSQDRYELLQYYVSKLETRKKQSEIFKFLLEFLVGITGNQHETVISSIFLADPKSLEFFPIAWIPEEQDIDLFQRELSGQIENGIVAWCINNRRAVFSPATQNDKGKNCLIIPISTSERTLGLAFLYLTMEEEQFARDSLQIMMLACIQTALYADNLSMVQELQNTQSKLVHSEKLSAIGQLAAGVAHEINNPVGYVLGNTEIMFEYIDALKKMIDASENGLSPEEFVNLRKKLDIDYIYDDITKLIQANLDGLKRVTQIVANLKDFAHIDRNRIEVYAPTNLEDNLRKTLMIASHEIKYGADVKIEFGNIAPINCNAGEINQVFLNIIVNAAQAIREQKHSKRGNIIIRTSQDTNSAYIEITDDGPGIHPTVLPKIFDPFFTTKPVGKGTGLGLNIAYDIIVNKYGGDISVKSEINKGTSFLIQLPRNPIMMQK